MVIKKIFDGNFDEEVHSDFLKFGRGSYKNKYLIEAKSQGGGKFSIKTSSEFANFLVRKCLENVEGKINISGVVISTFDLKEDFENVGIDIKKTSNFQGVRKTAVDCEVNPAEIINLMDKYPRCFFAFSFKTGVCELKIKPKAPKSGKPGKNDDVPVADFCSLKTTNKEIMKELLFGVGEFKECRISHEINVQDIIYPSSMKELKPEEIREQAKRKGVVVRKVECEGNSKTIEADFEA